MEIPAGPKGTRDFYPDDMAFQEHLFTSWRRTCKKYAFEPWDGPMFEHLEIFTQKSGAEIEKQLYTFKDKGERMMALRPEMTPSLARMIAAKGMSLKRPVRWYSIGRLFRYEKMQKGRLREFFQLNMDILGSSEVAADAELIAAATDTMRDLGLSHKDFRVRISSRTLLDKCFSAIGISREIFPMLYALLDRKNKITEEAYYEGLKQIITDDEMQKRIDTVFSVESLEETASFTGECEEYCLLKELFALLRNYGLSEYICFDINIVRGLAYYTGIVFEIFALDKNRRAIAGGGRYDKLVELYGGPPTPAVGFAAGDVVLGDLLREKNLLPPQKHRCDVFIAAIDESGYEKTIPTAQLLRSAGISCVFPLKRTNLGKQLKQADSSGAVLTVITGGEESVHGMVKIKQMNDGFEKTVPYDKLLENVSAML